MLLLILHFIREMFPAYESTSAEWFRKPHERIRIKEQHDRSWILQVGTSRIFSDVGAPGRRGQTDDAPLRPGVARAWALTVIPKTSAALCIMDDMIDDPLDKFRIDSCVRYEMCTDCSARQ